MTKRPNTPIARSFAATLAALTLAAPAIASETFQPSTTPVDAPMTLSDGIHLYGEAENPNEIGKSYAILEVEAGRVTGAFYQPHSSFDCFRGETQDAQLVLSITDSYTGETFPYAIAIQDTSLLAAVGDLPSSQPGLQGFHRLEEMSDRDRELLQICLAQ